MHPALTVFGHIHAARGREDLVLGSVRHTYEEVLSGWAGWISISDMAIGVLAANIVTALMRLGFFRGSSEKNFTTFVNAAVVGGLGTSCSTRPSSWISGSLGLGSGCLLVVKRTLDAHKNSKRLPSVRFKVLEGSYLAPVEESSKNLLDLFSH